jgi:hypothetical protein
VPLGASFVVDAIVATELFELVCSRVFDLSRPFVTVRPILGSRAVLDEDLVTVVTAPIPFTDDFWTGSSLVLSRTRSCIGIGCGKVSEHFELKKVGTYQLRHIINFLLASTSTTVWFGNSLGQNQIVVK